MKIETTTNTNQNQVVDQEADMANTATVETVEYGYSDTEIAEAAAHGICLDDECDEFTVESDWDNIEPEFFDAETFAGVSL